jgi:aryl-alcohol dehydrogenase-like predicted oxidoreductase
METRTLGRTGHRSTLITLGGAGARPTTRKASDEFIKLALDHGVNHIDVAPTYGSGMAERILGPWVKEYRNTLFLACKTQKRTKQAAAEELRASLKSLQTDSIDLYQLHGLDTLDELHTALGEDGAIQAFLEAQEQDLIRYIGITSHNPVTIMTALDRFDFDTVLLPVNYVLHAHPEPANDYEPVLALAQQRNLGVIAMKTAAKGPWPTDARPYLTWYQPFTTQRDVDNALRFTLSQYVTTAASSSDVRIATMMLDAAERYMPMDAKEQKDLLMSAATYTPLFPRATP